jgi:hypothetical protein
MDVVKQHATPENVKLALIGVYILAGAPKGERRGRWRKPRAARAAPAASLPPACSRLPS